MPRASKHNASSNRLNALVYGIPNSGKTQYVCAAAEAGFNVIIMDLDGGAGVTANLSAAAQERIAVLDMRPPVKVDVTKIWGAQAVLTILHKRTAIFDENRRVICAATDLKKFPDNNFALIRLDLASGLDILVVDSLTKLGAQEASRQTGGDDPLKVTRTEWDQTQKARLNVANGFSNLAAQPCHTVMIAHEETVALRKPGTDPKSQDPTVFEVPQTQPVCLTRNFGDLVAGYFQTVVHTTKGGAFTPWKVSTQGSQTLAAGVKLGKPRKETHEEMPITDFIDEGLKEAAASNTEFSSKAVIFGTGSEIAALLAGNKAPAEIKVGTAPTKLNLNRTKD